MKYTIIRNGKDCLPKSSKHYKIKNRALRRAFRGIPSFSLTPRSEAEETIVAGFIDRISTIVNEYARKVARKAINEIGRKD